jgi:ketosteroid isomerase-like protein
MKNSASEVETINGADTGRFLHDWFRRLAENGWTSGVFLAHLSEDIVWTATGSSPVSGTFRGLQAYTVGVFRKLDERLASRPTPKVERILVDGDWGVVEFTSTGGLGKNGTDYNMRYCWLMHITGEKVDQVIGYHDQLKVAELFN